MIRRFEVEGYIAGFRAIPNGFLITVGEEVYSRLGKPVYENLTICDRKANAIEPHLRKGALFRFTGSIEKQVKNGLVVSDYHIVAWKRLERRKRTKPEEILVDDDWFVPRIRERDRPSQRFAEGFPG